MVYVMWFLAILAGIVGGSLVTTEYFELEERREALGREEEVYETETLAKIDELQESISALEPRMEELVPAIRKLRSELSSLSDRKALLEQALGKKATEVANRADRKEELAATTEKYDMSIAELEKEAQKLEADIKTLRQMMTLAGG